MSIFSDIHASLARTNVSLSALGSISPVPLPTPANDSLGAVDSRADMAGALTAAMGRRDKRLRLAYSPIVRLTDDCIQGFRAVPRWTCAEIGDVGPGTLFDLAVEQNLGEVLDFWTLQECGLNSSSWRLDAPNAFVLVTLTGKLFAAPFGRSAIRAVMAGTGMLPRQFCAEVFHAGPDARTSIDKVLACGMGAVVCDHRAHTATHGSEQIGPRLAILDLGEVASWLEDRELEEILLGMVWRARQSGLTVLAKGVGSAADARAARRVGCELGCGPWYAEAVSPASARFILHSGNGLWRNG